MKTILHLPKIEAKEKQWLLVPDPFGAEKLLDPRLRDEVTELRDCVETGTPLPAYAYRLGLDDPDDIGDRMLEDYGYMHLHIKRDRNTLIIVQQWDDAVIFCGIADHNVFYGRAFAEFQQQVAPQITQMKAKNDHQDRIRQAVFNTWTPEQQKAWQAQQQTKQEARRQTVLARQQAREEAKRQTVVSKQTLQAQRPTDQQLAASLAKFQTSSPRRQTRTESHTPTLRYLINLVSRPLQ